MFGGKFKSYSQDSSKFLVAGRDVSSTLQSCHASGRKLHTILATLRDFENLNVI